MLGWPCPPFCGGTKGSSSPPLKLIGPRLKLITTPTSGFCAATFPCVGVHTATLASARHQRWAHPVDVLLVITV